MPSSYTRAPRVPGPVRLLAMDAAEIARLAHGLIDERALPESTRVVEGASHVPPVASVDASIREALAAPVDHEPLRHLVGPGAKVTIAFDDCAAVFPPMAPPDFREVALPIVISELIDAGVDLGDVRLVCANALHRKWTRRELASIIGEQYATMWPPQRLGCHDACDPDNLVFLGETARGMEVEVNRAVVDSDLVIYVNATATPFNGGWKSIVVGLSSWRSIRHHHRPFPFAGGHSVMDPRRSAFQKLLGELGAVVEAELATRGRRLFTVEAALTSTPPYQVTAVSAGHIPSVHRRTLDVLAEEQVVRVEGQSDALLLALPPAGPYAAFSRTNPLLTLQLGLGYMFNLHMDMPLVREGGVLILHAGWAADFDDRAHPSYRELYEKVLPQTRDPFEVWDRFGEDFANRPEYVYAYRYQHGFHGGHPLFMWAANAFPRRYLSSIILSGCDDPTVATTLGCEGYPDLPSALAAAADRLGAGHSLTYHRLPPLSLAHVSA